VGPASAGKGGNACCRTRLGRPLPGQAGPACACTAAGLLVHVQCRTVQGRAGQTAQGLALPLFACYGSVVTQWLYPVLPMPTHPATHPATHSATHSATHLPA